MPLLLLSSAAQNNQQRGSSQTSMKGEPRIVHADVPMYPHDARIAHIIGTVEVQVTVKGGRVTDTTVKSGHPLLAKASTDNIKSWSFEPDVNETFMTKFIYEMEDEKMASVQRTNPKIEMHLPSLVKIIARPILLEDPAATTTKPSH
jgi:Gram-negative bacterial TonB protein C-terminal